MNSVDICTSKGGAGGAKQAFLAAECEPRPLCYPDSVRNVTLFAAAVLAACGGKASDGTGEIREPPAGDGGAQKVDASTSRVPKKHRPQHIICPAERASAPPGENASTCGQSSGPISDTCTTHADCADGSNGRCSEGRFNCSCSYDDCTEDTDCGPRVPCECREASDTFGTNDCETDSNCRVDADCGAHGYCSPSLVRAFCSCVSPAFCKPGEARCSPSGSCSCGDSCGHGYFCHTKADTCVDDEDCNQGESCNFDLPTQSFMCTGCLPIP